MNRLLLATEKGIVTCEKHDGEWQEDARALNDRKVTSISGRSSTVLAGTRNGIVRSADGGQTWMEASDGLTTRHIRWIALGPEQSGLVLAGTEPANIFVSRDDGQTWRARPEVADLRDRFRWSLPYSPDAGCVRGFALHGARAYAAVEVGGVLVSDDHGETWQLAGGSHGRPGFEASPEPWVYPDVHSLEVHPSSPALVYAPTGGGFYRSQDGGESWQLCYDCYCRAVWVDPRDPDHLILGPADGVDRNGRIEESNDGGRTWSPASRGLQVPWRRGMVERFFDAGGELFAVLSGGQVFSTPLSTLAWERTFTQVDAVHAMTAMD